MVHLEEVEDPDLVREQPGPYEGDDNDDEGDYTDTDSCLSSASDLPSSFATTLHESALERIYALKDMIPPSTRRSIAATGSGLYTALKSTALFSGKGLYMLSTGGLMVLVPYMLAVVEEQQIVEMEREQKAREMGSEIISPTGAQAGGGQGQGQGQGARASL